MLALIGDSFGAAAAFDVSTLFVHDAERQARLERGPALRPGHASAPLRRVLREMVDTLEQPQSIERLAHAAHLSTRTLNRLFASELGMPPGRYYRLLRLSRARELAAGRELTQQQIAVRCGFASAASLAKAYSAQFGHPLGRPRGR